MTTSEERAFTERVEAGLVRALSPPSLGDSGVLALAARHLCLAAGAKRGRPRLVWLFAHCLEQPPPITALTDVAVAAELIHSASLLHDDVVDHGSLRRGLPTANARWGNTVAVLAGDLLLTTALAQLQRHPRSLTRKANETIGAMTRAAIAEVEARGRLDLSAAHWRRIAVGKTGALFSWCASAVASLGADRTDALRRAGQASVCCLPP